MDSNNRAIAIQAVDVLNDFIGDCVASVMVLNEYVQILSGKKEQETALIAIHKMCLSYLVITLNKWLEFYDKYHSIIPSHLHNECKELTKDLKRRQVNEFRNKCVGHIWDKKNKRPLYNSEINESLNAIIGTSLSEFLNWVNNPYGNHYPNTVVSIIETVRNELAENYSISYEEIKTK